MDKRTLGNSSLEVSPICLGGNVFGWTIDEPTSLKILNTFTGLGFNFIDTADVYSKWATGNQGGESETIIGNWLKQSGRRNQLIIATKVGMELGPDRKGLSKSYILRSAEDSLKRLQTDYIDLYQSHTDDKETPLEETLEAYAQLISEGKVRVIGASNYSGERLHRALHVSREHNLPSYQSLQPQYNLYDRADYETNLQPVVEHHGLGVIPYYSLGAGFLTGKYRSANDANGKARGGTVQKYINDRGMRILAALDDVAAQLNSNPTKVALAWLLTRATVTAPIVSATNLDQLKDLVEAADLVLQPTHVERLQTASAPAALHATA